MTRRYTPAGCGEILSGAVVLIAFLVFVWLAFNELQQVLEKEFWQWQSLLDPYGAGTTPR